MPFRHSSPTFPLTNALSYLQLLPVILTCETGITIVEVLDTV